MLYDLPLVWKYFNNLSITTWVHIWHYLRCRETLEAVQKKKKEQILSKHVIKLKFIKSKLAKKNAKPTNQLEKSETSQALMNQKGLRRDYHVDKIFAY